MKMEYKMIKHTNYQGTWYKIYKDDNILDVYLNKDRAMEAWQNIKDTQESIEFLDSFLTEATKEREYQCPYCATIFPESLGKVLF